MDHIEYLTESKIIRRLYDQLYLCLWVLLLYIEFGINNNYI